MRQQAQGCGRRAEAQASALSEVMEVNLKELVTKEHLDARLLQLEQRMTIKLGSMMVVAIAVVAALIKLL